MLLPNVPDQIRSMLKLGIGRNPILLSSRWIYHHPISTHLMTHIYPTHLPGAPKG